LSWFTNRGTQGTPGLNIWAQRIWITESRSFDPSPKFSNQTQGHLAPTELGKRIRGASSPQEASQINIIVFTSCYIHPYPKTDKIFNQKVTQSPYHECLPLMMDYNSYRPVGYSEAKPGYDIMRYNDTSMKYMSVIPQVIILWSAVTEPPQEGVHRQDQLERFSVK
jgi:hypothetical protein